ncbi:MAG: CDP-alcohol phosphatidyltransferase family protein [Chlamydiales bacterium]
MQIALYLTLGRLLLGPLFLLIYLYYSYLGISFALLPYILFALLLFSEVSDILDGFIARKWDQVTELGKVLDPMADSIARISVFLTFTQGIIQLPLILVFIFFYRDSIVSTLRTICALKGIALAARITGKIKAIVQAAASFMIVLFILLYSQGRISLQILQFNSLCIASFAACYTVFSGIEYIYSNREYIKRAWVN